MTLCIVGFDDLVTSFVATIATGWSDPCRVRLSPTGKPRLYAAHALFHRSSVDSEGSPLVNVDLPWWRRPDTPTGTGEDILLSFRLWKSWRVSNVFEARIATLAMGGNFSDKIGRIRCQVSLRIPRRDCP